MNRRIVTWLAALFLAAGLLAAAGQTESKTPDRQKDKTIVRVDGETIVIDLKDLQRELAQLRDVDLQAVRRALAGLPDTLKQVKAEMADLPARLEAAHAELEKLPAVMQQVEKELSRLPAALKGMDRELDQLKDLDVDRIVAEALKSLDGLDKRIEKAVKTKAQAEKKSG